MEENRILKEQNAALKAEYNLAKNLVIKFNFMQERRTKKF